MTPSDLQLAGALVDGAGPGWAPKRLLGVRVRKFSRWHRLLLRTIDSPFLRAGNVTWNDLRIAVAVCRTQYRDSRLRKPTLVYWFIRLWPILTAIAFRSPFRRKIPSSPENPRQRALRKHTEAFLAYCGDYLQAPEYTIIPPETQGPSKPRGKAPSEMEEVWDIIVSTHWSDDLVWNMPIGWSNWCQVMSLRSQGYDVSFAREEEKGIEAKLPPEFRRYAQ